MLANMFLHMWLWVTLLADTQSTWEQDILLAAEVGIDAFALNMGYPDPNIPIQVANAFNALDALNLDFKLFFSFDYLGGGEPWPATGNNSVVSYLQEYATSQHYGNLYFQYYSCRLFRRLKGQLTSMIGLQEELFVPK